MKYVEKGPPPAELGAWISDWPPEHVPTFPELPNPLKHDVLLKLIAEQGGVCCYCGQEITAETAHIEHFRPQSWAQYKDLQLDFNNLFASCLRSTVKSGPLHCGHAKGGEFSEDSAISPSSFGCERRFRFTLDGQIVAEATVDESASYMVTLLKLNSPILRLGRERLLDGAFDADFIETATDADLEALKNSYRQRDVFERLSSFGHVVARYAEQLLEHF